MGIEFSIEKCVMHIMKNAKREITEGIKQPNQERITTLGGNENKNTREYWEWAPSNMTKWKKK